MPCLRPRPRGRVTCTPTSSAISTALLLIDRALEIDENLATAWQRRGWVCGYAGGTDGAIASLQRAIRLNPLDRVSFSPRAR